MISRVLLLLAALPLSSCGYETDVLPAAGATLRTFRESAVHLATPAELAADEAVEGSYIVTFRSDARAQGFGSYLSEYRHHYMPLVERYLADPRVADINYIDHVNLADP